MEQQRPKALTLWQPWATLVAIGAKKIETRSWSTTYRGTLVIHAGTHKAELHTMFGTTFYEVLYKAGYKDLEDLPLGVGLCVVRLADCVHTEMFNPDAMGPHERVFGNYAPGRYAWVLDSLQAFEKPIRCKGQHGLWEWPYELPEVGA